MQYFEDLRKTIDKMQSEWEALFDSLKQQQCILLYYN